MIAAARIEEEVYGGTPGREMNRRFELPGVSRLPGQGEAKQNFMNLRTRGNRSGLHSLDRNQGLVGIGGVNGARRGYHPQTNTTRKDGRLNYNSSSIPYLNKRQQVENSLGPLPMASKNQYQKQNPRQRPENYTPLGLSKA